MINLAERELIIRNAWSLCASTGTRVLVVEEFGLLKAYAITEFTPKSRDVFVNEVRYSQEITEIVKNLNFNAGITQQQYIEQTGSVELKTFKFAHDQFMLMESNTVNYGNGQMVRDNNSSSGWSLQ